MITNAEYLIQRYAEAREKQQEYGSMGTGQMYWKGVMDTYHSLLTLGFNDWALPNSTGYFVFYKGMNYEEALNAHSKSRVLENC